MHAKQAMILHLSCINYHVIFSLSNMILNHQGTDSVYVAKHNKDMHNMCGVMFTKKKLCMKE